MKPKIQKTQSLYSGYFDLRQDLLERPDGLVHSYTFLVLATDAAVVLAQTKEGLWVLNREYRHPTGEVLLGLPGGRLEKGEDPMVAGQREFFEETGYWSDEISLVGCSHPFPAIGNQKVYYLWAKNAVKKGEPHLEPFEFIKIELMTDEALRRELRTSSKTDGNICTALWYKDHFC